MQKSRAHFLIAAVIVIYALISGCTKPPKYILVDSSLVDTTLSDRKEAEVTITPRYSEKISDVKSVAISAPSSCTNQNTSTATGSAVNKGSVVVTDCGVQLAEIERALVRHGYTVYSWKLINNISNPNSPDKVARQLGAQVLFQVNSLERINVTPSRDARVVRNFFLSNEYGEKLEHLELNERDIENINSAIGKIELKRLPSATSLGAMLDISAIDSETGQTIWFYRWNKQEDNSKNLFSTSLLVCRSWGCEQKRPEDKEPQQTPNEARSSEVETLSTTARPANEQDVVYFRLLQDVTADFIKTFSAGRLGK